MKNYPKDAPGSSDPWAPYDGERWTLTGAEGEWTDEEQWARETLGGETNPGQEPDWDGCDPPAHDGEAC